MEEVKGIFSAGGLGYAVPGPLSQPADELPDGGFVIDHENHAGIITKRTQFGV